MSKYTTELRWICESKYDQRPRSTPTPDDIILNTYEMIIHPNVQLYDPAYEEVLYPKIIKHYYFDEIGHETVGRFIFRLNTKLEEILPYYNKLYESALLEFNPFYDVDYTREGTKEDNGTNNATRTDNLNQQRTDNLNSLRTDNLNQQRTDALQNSAQSESYDLYSETPEGSLTGVDNKTYLTNARKINSTASGSNTGTQTTANTGTQTVADTGTQTVANTGTQTNAAIIHNENEYFEHVVGKMGGANYAELLTRFRETFLNIDMMIIKELEPLFMGIF